MNIIHFITSAPIEYKIGDLSLYDSFDAVSQGKISAPLVPDAASRLLRHSFSFDPRSIKNIFTAIEGQTASTAQLLVASGITPHARIHSLAALDPVRFSMRDLITPEKFEKLSPEQALQEARDRFVRKLFRNELGEPVSSLLSRFRLLIEHALIHEGDTLCIGHAFYLKILQIYMEDVRSFSREKYLISSFNPSKKPFESLSGFSYAFKKQNKS